MLQAVSHLAKGFLECAYAKRGKERERGRKRKRRERERQARFVNL